MSIVFEYPAWLSFVCLLAGILYAGILYYRDKKLTEFSKGIIRLLFTIRAIVVTLLALFLLSPMIKQLKRVVEKPIIIIAQDNSESIAATKDSNYYKGAYKQALEKLKLDLQEKYEVRSFSFADKVKELTNFDSLDYKEKQTDASDLFNELETRFSNRNVGAVIFASDGLYNKGANPIYTNSSLKAPIYTVALGDTTVKKDIILSKVEHNRLAYLGNKFPLEIVVQAKKYKGKSTVLKVKKGDLVLFTQEINFANDAFIQTIPVLLDAKEVGLQRYRIELSTLSDEMNLTNNSLDIFIDVLDARQKVLILATAPHPDIAAIKAALDDNQNYEAVYFLVDDFKENIKKYNLVIGYQLATTNAITNKIINDIKLNAIPYWCFTGAGSILKNDFSLIPSQKSNDAEPVIDKTFPLFTLSDELIKAVKDFPAVVSPYVSSAADNQGNNLLYQRIGIVDTQIPLMTFKTINENKFAVFNGEGIWRWRLQDFAAHNNHQVFNEFITKTVQYLSVKEDKSFFRISCANNFFENENIELEAEVYNQSYELITEPEVTISIINSNNKKFPYAFSTTSNGYRLNAGMLPVDNYKYEAQVKIGDKVYKQQGSFSVSALKVELNNTMADYQLLYTLAKKHDAEMFYPLQFNELSQKLLAREDIKSISYSDKLLTDLVNFKWILFLLIALLGLEWFIRKRNGSY